MGSLRTFGREIEVAINKMASPAARRAEIVRLAEGVLQDAQAKNRAELGSVPPHTTIVDGRRDASLSSINPDRGTIVFAFDLGGDVVEKVLAEVVKHSPVLTGEYRDSHLVFADGDEVTGSMPTGADRRKVREWAIVAGVAYGRKIERGQSKQAPDGVYEAVAVLAARRFGNIANISFTYRSPLLAYIPGARNRDERQALRADTGRLAAMRLERTTRQPAIIIRPR